MRHRITNFQVIGCKWEVNIISLIAAAGDSFSSTAGGSGCGTNPPQDYRGV